MDSLYQIAAEYPIVEDEYLYALVGMQNNYIREQQYSQAYRTAHRCYELFPERYEAQQALSSLYNTLAMNEIRKNERRKAHKILMEGLSYLPDDPVLNNVMDSLMETF